MGRLILYYPVSALVTLFANILQNPQDVRARGDLKLMSSVCSFLTMLERDVAESNGNVRRMLSVCSEFERIASVVLDKAERDVRGGRNKRKQAEREKAKDRAEANPVSAGLDEGKSLEQIQVETQAGYRRPVQTPSLRASQGGSSAKAESPASWGNSPIGGTGPEYRTPNATFTDNGIHQHRQQQPQQRDPSSQWLHAYSMQNGGLSPFRQQHQQFNNSLSQATPYSHNGMTSNADFNPTTTGFSPDAPVGFDMNNSSSFGTSDMANGAASFQQPFVPQDLWQMPMTLEWDWAEGLGLGSFTPGLMFDGASYGLGDGMGRQ